MKEWRVRGPREHLCSGPTAPWEKGTPRLRRSQLSVAPVSGVEGHGKGVPSPQDFPLQNFPPSQ